MKHSFISIFFSLRIIFGATMMWLSWTVVPVLCNAQTFTILHSRHMSDTLQIPVTDLRKYFDCTVPDATIRIEQTARGKKLPDGHLVVVVEPGDRTIQKLCRQYGISNPPTAWNSFRISSFRRHDNRSHYIYFLEGADSWGRQYAVYDLAERLLGVRYLMPGEDHIVVQSRFEAKLVNTGVQQPDYKWRGLYPWHYNYNSRGLATFCDINVHFVSRDWEWFHRLGDWMVKNKQNAILWFDDVFAHENISGQFPDSLSNYLAIRGIRQILGMGWASNEDSRHKQGVQNTICLDSLGRSVEDATWKRAICPLSEEYFRHADTNFSRMNLRQPGNYLGILIGYGENSWAAQEKGVNCVRHAGRPSGEIMLRDLDFVKSRFQQAGLGHLPMGYVTSTHSIHPGNPFETDYFIQGLPNNAIFSMHTYQQSGWRQFEQLYEKINRRNREEGTSIKVFHIAEAAFICNADIPLLKPSILRRRSEHYRTLPRTHTIGHLATLNTTQYLYWYDTYRFMRWQWQQDGVTSWDEDNRQEFTNLFGASNGEALNDIFNRLICLEYVLPSTAADSLNRTVPDLLPPPGWSRYNSKTHPANFGFRLWADEKDMQRLEDAEQSIGEILRTNDRLSAHADPLYHRHFHATIALTAHYYAIRVRTGKYHRFMDEAQTMYTAGGWSSEVEQRLRLAKQELCRAKESSQAYNCFFHSLLPKDKPADSQDVKSDIERDFVINPSLHYFQERIDAIDRILQETTFSTSMQ